MAFVPPYWTNLLKNLAIWWDGGWGMSHRITACQYRQPDLCNPDSWVSWTKQKLARSWVLSATRLDWWRPNCKHDREIIYGVATKERQNFVNIIMYLKNQLREGSATSATPNLSSMSNYLTHLITFCEDDSLLYCLQSLWRDSITRSRVEYNSSRR